MTIATNLLPLATPLGELSLLPGNPRRGDVEAVARSLQRFGQLKPIVARLDGTVIAGNHTLLAARSLGWDELAVVHTDADDATAKAFALADNRTSELGTYDEGDLLALLTEVGEADPSLLTDAGYADDALAELLAQLSPADARTAGPPDEIPEDPPAITEPGDVWVLGPHRLVCGDYSTPGVLELALDHDTPDLILTDPPYGISIVHSSGKLVGQWGSKPASFGKVDDAIGTPFRGTKGTGPIVPTTAYRPIIGDASPELAGEAFTALTAAYPTAHHAWWGANHYAGSAGLPNASCWLVWDKGNGDNHFADAELAWTNQGGPVRVLAHRWSGFLRDSERGLHLHPTQKPVALQAWVIETLDPDHARPLVLDPFAGSGSTLIAAEVTGHRAALVEIDPRYCDVIVERWRQATGGTPTKD